MTNEQLLDIAKSLSQTELQTYLREYTNFIVYASWNFETKKYDVHINHKTELMLCHSFVEFDSFEEALEFGLKEAVKLIQPK